MRVFASRARWLRSRARLALRARAAFGHFVERVQTRTAENMRRDWKSGSLFRIAR